MNHNLSVNAKNIYSQYGEDGIIAEILLLLPESDKWCVEFGAWDGRHLSNTCNLIENKGFSAVLIEGDPNKCEELKENFKSNPKVIAFERFVGFSENTLDEILSETPIPLNFDFLSIDIDGCDYHIWESLSKFAPKVVCIEYNPTIANGINFVQERTFKEAQGASISSIVELGVSKGYELVATTLTNCFFVRSELYSIFKIEDNSIESLRTDTTWVSNIFCDYNGKIHIVGSNQCPWNGLRLDRMVKQLPRSLQGLPSNMPALRCKCLGLWKKIFRLNYTQK